jgi:hypothetical protein
VSVTPRSRQAERPKPKTEADPANDHCVLLSEMLCSPARLSPFVTVVALCSKSVCAGRTPQDRLQFVAPSDDHLSHGARANESVEERHIHHGLEPRKREPGKRDRSDYAKPGKIAGTPNYQKRTCPAFSSRTRKPSSAFLHAADSIATHAKRRLSLINE